MCPTPDSTLADPQEINGDLQHQLAQCRAERDEALAREKAMADVLRLINSSSGDLAPVFDTILEKAHTLCGAEHGALVLYDGERFRAVATHNLPPEFAELYRQPFRTRLALRGNSCSMASALFTFLITWRGRGPTA